MANEQELQLQIDDLRRELKSVYNVVAQLKENLGVLGFTGGENIHAYDQCSFFEWKEKLEFSKRGDDVNKDIHYDEFQPRNAVNGILSPRPPIPSPKN